LDVSYHWHHPARIADDIHQSEVQTIFQPVQTTSNNDARPAIARIGA
jgi:hypothetical protein